MPHVATIGKVIMVAIIDNSQYEGHGDEKRKFSIYLSRGAIETAKIIAPEFSVKSRETVNL